jgi:alkylhydroperoxidase family enzyme
VTSRVEPLSFKQFPPKMRDVFKAVNPPNPRYRLKSEGRPSGANILGALAHHPALAEAFCTLQAHLLMNTTLSERQRELVIMRVAALRESNYEWAQHVFIAQDAGLTDLEIGCIASGSHAPCWDVADAALLRAVDELDRDGTIGENTWTSLSAHLNTQQILDTIFTAGSYSMLATMVTSLGVSLDEDLRVAVDALIRPTQSRDVTD